MAQLSLKKRIYSFAIYVFAGVLILTWLTVFLLSRYSSAHEKHMLQESSQTNAAVIGSDLILFQRLLERIANQQELIDILVVGSETDAMDWAIRTRKYLPDNLGLALVLPDYTVLGDPLKQNLGNSCVNELLNIKEGISDDNPSFHDDNASLVHFDMTFPIIGHDEEKLGFLFSSFHVHALQDTLDNLVQDGQQLELITKDKRLIVSSAKGELTEKPMVRTQLVPGTSWQIVEKMAPLEFGTYFSYILLFSSFLGLVLGFAVIRISNHVINEFLSEIDTIIEQFRKITDDAHSRSPAVYRYLETARIKPLVEQISHLIYEQKEKLVFQSSTDELTGLYNRRKFCNESERASHMAHRGVMVCMMLLDLDKFKQLNDSEGHHAGDAVLQLLADSLLKVKRGTDIVARLGGDEFAVLFINMDKSGLEEWYQRLKEEFIKAQENEACLSGNTICTLSAGATCFKANHQEKSEQILKLTDKALYQAKRNGKNQLVFIDE